MEQKGVKFHLENPVKEFIGDGGRLKNIILKDGSTLESPLCIVAAGKL